MVGNVWILLAILLSFVAGQLALGITEWLMFNKPHDSGAAGLLLDLASEAKDLSSPRDLSPEPTPADEISHPAIEPPTTDNAPRSGGCVETPAPSPTGLTDGDTVLNFFRTSRPRGRYCEATAPSRVLLHFPSSVGHCTRPRMAGETLADCVVEDRCGGSARGRSPLARRMLSTNG